MQEICRWPNVLQGGAEQEMERIKDIQVEHTFELIKFVGPHLLPYAEENRTRKASFELRLSPDREMLTLNNVREVVRLSRYPHSDKSDLRRIAEMVYPETGLSLEWGEKYEAWNNGCGGSGYQMKKIEIVRRPFFQYEGKDPSDGWDTDIFYKYHKVQAEYYWCLGQPVPAIGERKINLDGYAMASVNLFNDMDYRIQSACVILPNPQKDKRAFNIKTHRLLETSIVPYLINDYSNVRHPVVGEACAVKISVDQMGHTVDL